jgi:hypothetical protein
VRRPTPSELAAASWLLGGLLATGALQALTGGQHSVSHGLRQHKLAFSCAAAVFLAHILVPDRVRPVDPFRWSAVVLGTDRTQLRPVPRVAQ